MLEFKVERSPGFSAASWDGHILSHLVHEPNSSRHVARFYKIWLAVRFTVPVEKPSCRHAGLQRPLIARPFCPQSCLFACCTRCQALCTDACKGIEFQAEGKCCEVGRRCHNFSGLVEYRLSGLVWGCPVFGGQSGLRMLLGIVSLF